MADTFKQRPDLAALNGLLPGTTAESLGLQVTEQGEDFLRATMPVDPRTKTPFGLLHGGASVLMAETLASLAGFLCLDPAEKKQAAGIEINANHLRAVTEGIVTGTARPIHLGRATQVWEIRIEDERGRLVCISRMTAAVIGI
jgi:1,4-dihydroxy-2-naphthoyl-CoA hydrolase